MKEVCLSYGDYVDNEASPPARARVVLSKLLFRLCGQTLTLLSKTLKLWQKEH
jgi:hypothetical protein